MGRVVGLPLLLVALAIGAYVFVAQIRSTSSSPTSPQSIAQDESQATSAVAATNLQHSLPMPAREIGEAGNVGLDEVLAQLHLVDTQILAIGDLHRGKNASKRINQCHRCFPST
jgi:hypothetical protein